jgi:hypothetical protein
LDSSSIGAGFFSRFPDPNKSTPFDSNFQVDNRDEEILTSIPVSFLIIYFTICNFILKETYS